MLKTRSIDSSLLIGIETTLTPSRNICCDNDALNNEINQAPSRQEFDPIDESGIDRMHEMQEVAVIATK